MFSPRSFFGSSFGADALTRRVAPVPQPPSTLGIFSLRSFNAIAFAPRSLDHTYIGEGAGGGGGGTDPPTVTGDWARIQRQAQNWQRQSRAAQGWARQARGTPVWVATDDARGYLYWDETGALVWSSDLIHWGT